ncbi:MAG: hypothetical protein JST48_00905 [Bacteroidetes bacterium]|nr:hypothetical protein [Bacteroidota bacterium]
MKNVISVLILLVASTSAWAQCTEYKWPENPAQAEKQVDAIKAAIKDQNYKAATGGLNWMLKNVPQWHSDLYVYALDVYDNLAGQEMDPVTKQTYIDSLMLVYDMRIANCGDEMNVLNRKAYHAYKYNGNNKDKAAAVLAIFDKTFEVSGNNVSDVNLGFYMGIIQNNVEMFHTPNEEQVMQRYNKLMEVVEAKIKKAQEQNKAGLVSKYKKVVEGIDANLAKSVKMNCDFIKKNFEPKFAANTKNTLWADKVYQFMLDEKCPANEAWMQAAELLHSTSPNFDVTKELCSAYINAKNFDKATPLMTELQTKAKSAKQKSWIEILKGDIEFQKGNKSAARTLYRNALTLDAGMKLANERIGDLYMSSGSDCSKTPGSAEEKLVNIAAFQIYLKSGNREKMKQALDQYPTPEDLQKAGWKTGEQKKLACWIEESVTVKAHSDND